MDVAPFAMLLPVELAPFALLSPPEVDLLLLQAVAQLSGPPGPQIGLLADVLELSLKYTEEEEAAAGSASTATSSDSAASTASRADTPPPLLAATPDLSSDDGSSVAPAAPPPAVRGRAAKRNPKAKKPAARGAPQAGKKKKKKKGTAAAAKLRRARVYACDLCAYTCNDASNFNRCVGLEERDTERRRLITEEKRVTGVLLPTRSAPFLSFFLSFYYYSCFHTQSLSQTN